VRHYFAGNLEYTVINKVMRDRKFSPRVLIRRSIEMVQCEINKYYGMSIPISGSTMSPNELVGCPTNLCFRANVDAMLVDTYNILKATDSPKEVYKVEDQFPALYIFSGADYALVPEISYNEDGRLDTIPMKKFPGLSFKLKDFVSTWKKWYEIDFPIHCAIDATFLVVAPLNLTNENRPFRAVWGVFKDEYIYWFHIQLNLRHKIMSDQIVPIVMRISEIKEVFPRSPTYVEGSATINDAIILFHGKKKKLRT
jgi:hypothetical protein